MSFLRNTNVRRNRSLQIESLENRELLSVNPLGIDNTTPAVYAAAAPAPIAAAAEAPDVGGTIATAQAIALGKSVDGYLDSADVDIYKVTVTAGQKLVFVTAATTGKDTVDTCLRLFDAEGTPLDGNDDGGMGMYSRLDYTFDTAGTYYIGVSYYANISYDPTDGSGTSGSDTGYYTLSVQGSDPLAPTNARDQAVAADLIAHGASADDINWNVIDGKNRIVFIDGWNLSGNIDVSNCTALEDFAAYGAAITSLNVSGCTALMSLAVYDNQLTTLDVSGLTNLQYLYCSSNQLKTLDVSSCTALSELNCNSNSMLTLLLPQSMQGFSYVEAEYGNEGIEIINVNAVAVESVIATGTQITVKITGKANTNYTLAAWDYDDNDKGAQMLVFITTDAAGKGTFQVAQNAALDCIEIYGGKGQPVFDDYDWRWRVVDENDSTKNLPLVGDRINVYGYGDVPQITIDDKATSDTSITFSASDDYEFFTRITVIGKLDGATTDSTYTVSISGEGKVNTPSFLYKDGNKTNYTLSFDWVSQQIRFTLGGLASNKTQSFAIVFSGGWPGDGSESYYTWISNLSNTVTATTSLTAPAKPTLTTGTTTDASVKLTWTAVSGVTGYELEYIKSSELSGGFSADEPTWSVWTPAPGASATSAIVTGLPANTKHSFRLRAVKDGVPSDWSATVEETTAKTGTAVPDAPTLTKGTTTSTTVELSWKAVAGATYVLQYKTENDGWKEVPAGQLKLDGTDTITATVSGLTASTAYQFKVQATNDGGGKSDWSAVVDATTSSAATVKPAAPTNFTASIPTLDSVTLSWKAVDGATSYELQYSTSPTGTGGWKDVPAGDISGTTATVKGLAAGTTYYFQVVAVNGGVKSEVAKTNATTKSSDASKQQPPNNVKVEITKDKETKSATITWTAPEGATNKTVYVIQYRIVGTTKWKKVTVKATNKAGLTKDLKLKAGENYEFQIFVKGVKRGPTDSNFIEAGELQAWKVIPTASLAVFKAGLAKDKVTLQVKNYLPSDTAPAIGKGSKTGEVDTLTVTYTYGKTKDMKAKNLETVTLTYDTVKKEWIADGLKSNVKVNFTKDGKIEIELLSPGTKYAVTAEFSNEKQGSEATVAKPSGKSVSTLKS